MKTPSAAMIAALAGTLGAGAYRLPTRVRGRARREAPAPRTEADDARLASILADAEARRERKRAKRLKAAQGEAKRADGA